MTPKEKAENLVLMFSNYAQGNPNDVARIQAKRCALLAVMEILQENINEYADRRYDYWEKVKQEIENL